MKDRLRPVEELVMNLLNCIKETRPGFDQALNDVRLALAGEVYTAHVRGLRTELADKNEIIRHLCHLVASITLGLPDDIKRADGATMQFVDPDPHRTLRHIRECVREARAKVNEVQRELVRDRRIFGTSWERVDADGMRTRIDPRRVLVAPE